MPTISNKTRLGSLYNGDIVSFDYNFQTSSESSTASLLIYNKNNSYQKPILNSKVTLPIFGSLMRVVEYGIVDDSNKKTLQVQLEDISAITLDNNLILIRGIHSTGVGDDKIESPFYSVYNYGALPDSAISDVVLQKQDFERSSTEQNFKKISDGVYLMGRIRSSYSPNSEVSWNNGMNFWRPGEPPIWAKYESREYSEDLSRWPNINIDNIEAIIKEDGGISIEYGYTLSDLKKLVENLGIRIIDKGVMNDNLTLFQESGPLRSCLSSVLSKIGKSFYIDPFSGNLVVISNADIQQINNNVKTFLNEVDLSGGAEQTSLVESIKGVQSNHVVLKGGIPELTNSRGGQASYDRDRMRRAVFFRLPISSLLDQILPDNRTKELVSKTMYLAALGIDDGIIDKYLFGLAQKEDPSLWGEIYNNKNIKKTTLLSKTGGSNETFSFSNTTVTIPNSITLNGFNTNKTIGCYKLTRDAPSGEDDKAISASSVGFNELLKGVSRLWGGVFFSNSASFARLNKRRFVSTEYSFYSYREDEYLSNIPELSFLQDMIKITGGNVNLKVSDLAQISGAVSRSGEYHIIAIKNIFGGPLGQNTIANIPDIVNKNCVLIDSDENEQQGTLFLFINNEFASTINSISNLCKNKFNEEKSSARRRIVLRYQVDDSSEQNQSNDEQDGQSDETPQIFSLKQLSSKISNFSSRNLIYIQGPYNEIDIVSENLLTISPENEGPMISSEITYYRAPKKTDLDINKGVDSISISMSDQGITTRVRYSSKKFLSYDQSILVNYLGAGFNYDNPRISSIFKRQLPKSAFSRNR